MNNTLLKCMLGSYGLSALIGILSILGGGFGLTLNLLGTSLVVSGALTLLLLAALLKSSGHHKLRFLMIFSAVMTVLSSVIALAFIWSGSNDPPEQGLKLMLLALTLSLSGLHFGYLLLWKHTNTSFRMVVGSLGIFNLFLVGLIVIAFYFDFIYPMLFQYISDDFFGRIVSAVVVLVLIGTVALPVMNYVLRGRHHERDTGVADRQIIVDISCPRCAFQCELKVGHVTCPQCKLLMKFEVQEPRCPCGYLLYRFEGSSCPECSRVISDHMRWQTLTPNSESSG